MISPPAAAEVLEPLVEIVPVAALLAVTGVTVFSQALLAPLHTALVVVVVLQLVLAQMAPAV
jgi:hypothetical protein